MVSLRAALCRLYHDRVLSNAEYGGSEKRLYYIISYTVTLSNGPYAIRTPWKCRPGTYHSPRSWPSNARPPAVAAVQRRDHRELVRAWPRESRRAGCGL